MATSRYAFSKRTRNGKVIGKSNVSWKIYQAAESGALTTTIKILEEGERIDQLAGLYYGDSTLWWIISAASGIGWALQAPPGTRIVIPNNPSEAFSLIS